MREPHFKSFTLGRYRCDDRLRAGGVGDLYLAVHLPTGSRCTVWRVRPELFDDPEAAEQLLQIQHRVQSLTHPNIVAIREILRRENQVYVTMDYQPGISLRELLFRLRQVGPPPAPLAGFVVWQICQALDHAHRLKVDGRPAPLLHGALWPQNVVLSFKGEVRLVDFGTWLIPRVAYGDDEVSVRTHFGYRAPEHVTGDVLTRSTDLFCVGILLFEMMTGRPLFLAATLMETVQLVERAVLGPMTGVAPALRQVLRRCMAAEPRERYADVSALVADLSLVVPGVGNPSVQWDLARFLATSFVARESPATRPAPLPGQEGDETTDINPRDLTDALVALSREHPEPLQGDDHADPPVEDTCVDAPVPEPLDLMSGEPGDEVPTVVQASPPELVGPKEPGKPLLGGALAALFPPEESRPREKPPLQPLETEETTGRQPPRGLGRGEPDASGGDGAGLGGDPTGGLAMEEEPTLDRSEPDAGKGQPAVLANAIVEDVPTVNEKRSAARDAERAPTGSARAPTLVPALPAAPSGHPSRQPTASTPAAAHSEPSSPRAPATGAGAGLFFEKGAAPSEGGGRGAASAVAGASAPPAVFEPDEGATGSTPFDPDAFSRSYSQSYQAYQKRSRVSPAHVMLGVAVLVFLVAVAMLVRRLVTRPAAAPRTVSVPLDSRVKRPDAPAPRARDDARGDAREIVQSTGKDYDDLLKGRLAPGVLRVDSQPVKARVYLGRELRGMTPTTLHLAPGQKAVLTLVAPGYTMVHKQAALPSDRGLSLEARLVKTAYPKPLSPPTGVLRLRCRGPEPHLRRVFVDQEDTGYSCDRVDLRLRSGSHRISLFSLEREHWANYRVKIKTRKATWLVLRGNRRLR